MHDVLIVGAGPAGSLAAILLARAGARVRVLERATFPRHKLCGDTFNPGALAHLAMHLPVDWLQARGRRLEGMVLTGPGGVTVSGVYGHGLEGRALRRADADGWLVDHARAAGVTVDEGIRVDAPLRDASGAVSGVTATTPRGGREECRARIVIAADGRESRLARSVGLARYAATPRRWAIGAYFTDVQGLTDAGEMHVRRGHYIGVAPMPEGLANACLVVPYTRGIRLHDPARTLTDALHADPVLAPRFADLRLAGPPAVLGPMAVDAHGVGVPGLFLAGDAAGFIDPITGDGLRYALHGATLTAAASAQVLEGRLPFSAALARLARDRGAAFGPKWRFNRALRRLVASPSAVVGAALAARALPQLFESMIRYAGDCGELTGVSYKFKVQSSK